MIINKCTQYEPENRYENCAQLSYDLEHPEELGLPYRRKLKGKMLLFSASAALTVLCGVGSLTGSVLARQTETSGYDYYVENAATVADSEKLQLYRKAIALNPEKETAWLGVLDAVGADNEFTAEEDSYITSLLSSRDNDRSQDNKTLFQKNEGGYVRFAYNLGMLYYYSEGSGQNKTSAGGWFDVVSRTDLGSLDLGDDDDKKNAWQTRATILGKISAYNSRIGQTNQAGDAQITYMDYWQDLMALMADDIAGQDNVVTELRLYNEIVYQICTHYDAFKEAGVTKEEMQTTLQTIRQAADNAKINDNQAAKELKQEIDDAIVIGDKQIQAAFAANAQIQTNETEASEGGEN